MVIGGNGSLTGAHVCQEHGVRVMGVPASIDNDLGCTALAIGTDTALNTIVQACDHIDDTARAHRRAFVIEVMGRACGYLAMASSVAVGADVALFREQQRDEAALVRAVSDAVRQGFARGKRRVLVIKAEGWRCPAPAWCVRCRRRSGAGDPGGGARPSGPRRSSELPRPMLSARLAYAAVMGLLGGATDEMVAWNSPSSGGGDS